MNKILLSFLVFGLLGISFVSCEKKAPGPDEGMEDPTISPDEWILMDSTYYNTFVVSLWNSSMPEPAHLGGSNFDMRSFTKNYKNADDVLEALMEMTPRTGPGGNPLDRFSYIDRAGRVGEEIGQGVYRNIGVGIQFMYRPGTSTVGLFIRLVQNNSPSESAELKRGMEILAIDGKTLSFSVDEDGYVTGSIAEANKLFTGDVSTLSVNDWTQETPQTSTVTIPTVAQWNVDPIVAKSVFEMEGDKKVGYMAFSSFQSVISGGQPNSYHNDLTDLFGEFASEGVNELIVDLRYNGGGATNAAELLTNLIVPMGNNGKVMYEYSVNEILEGWGWTDSNDPQAPFKPTKIHKVGSLNLSKVYFLVTSSSASASEMVINSLKPYMDVQVVSTNNRGTYGKPVGSFGIDVEDGKGKRLATLQIISFKMVNAAGQGDYFSGIAGNKQNSGDNVFRQLGDAQETMLNDALYHIQNGSYRSTQSQSRIMRGNRSIPVPDAIDFHIDKNVQGLYNLEYRPTIKLDR